MASFGNAAPVWYVGVAEVLGRRLERRAGAAFASMNVKLFFGCAERVVERLPASS